MYQVFVVLCCDDGLKRSTFIFCKNLHRRTSFLNNRIAALILTFPLVRLNFLYAFSWIFCTHSYICILPSEGLCSILILFKTKLRKDRNRRQEKNDTENNFNLCKKVKYRFALQRTLYS